MKSDKAKFKTELKQRIYRWTLDLVKYVDNLTKSQSARRIADQLIRSGTSVGANYIEAQAASSKKDFINFLHHSLKSANESKFWICLLRDSGKEDIDISDKLLNELTQLSNILGASLLTLKNKRQ
jgi:four helix bundle protein